MMDNLEGIKRKQNLMIDRPLGPSQESARMQKACMHDSAKVIVYLVAPGGQFFQSMPRVNVL